MYEVEIENRFWSKIERYDENHDKCWEVVAMCCNVDGYGVLGVNGKMILAHRFAFQNHHNRLIKDEMLICHTCDNPCCVNPHHLFEGTNQDNMTDKMKKGRHVVKLTDQKVLEIRKKYDKGEISHRQLAKEYGVSRQNIGDIINRKKWCHI